MWTGSEVKEISAEAMGLLGLQSFRQRAPWWGGDLQTLRNSILPDPAEFPGQRLFLEMQDDSSDKLAALLHRPVLDTKPNSPLVILIHGLAGTETSSYIIMTARALCNDGYTVMRLNLRGAGPSRPVCKLQYHAGRSVDLRDAVQSLDAEWQNRGVIPIGFSLGGNMVLKFAAEFADNLPVRAIASVSAPIDLALTAKFMLRRRNHLYNQKLLNDYKDQALGVGAIISNREHAAILRSRNFTDIDNWFVAPRNGFADAEDYWRQCMARQFMSGIRLPTLVMHAEDDPMVPVAPYLDYPWHDNNNLHPVITRRGGHMGFHSRIGPWYIHALRTFFERLI